MKIRITAVLLACALLLAACGRGEGEETVRAGSGEEERQNLLLWSYYETDAQIRGMDQLVAEFNEAQDTYALSWEYVPMSEFDRRISRAYTEQALPDLVLIDNPDMIRFIQLGMFEDITEQAREMELETAFFPASVETVTYKDRYYGVPFNSNNVCLIYNTEIFAESGEEVPEDWESFARTASALTDRNTGGFLMSCINSEQGAFQILSWILSASERMNRSGIEEAFTFLRDMVFSGSLSAECLNYSQTDIARKFAEGNIAMMENGPWVFAMLDEAGVPYALAPLPAGNRSAVILGGENLGVMRGKNKEGSIAFIRFCMEEGGIERFCAAAQMLPSRIESAKKSVEADPSLGVIMEQMDYAVPRTRIEGWNTYSAKITGAFSRMLEGSLSPEGAAKEILF